MSKLIMTKGLPGSGKSTWARSQESAALRVNKDEIRKMLNQPWSRELEKQVVKITNKMISSGLKTFEVVISDDTNLAYKHEKDLRWLAIECGSEFEVNDSFLKIPIEECIRRDSLRPEGERVGKAVIEDMYNRYLKDMPQPVVSQVNDTTLPSCIICDLDGTLAIHEGLRGPFEHEKAATDNVNKAVDHIVCWAHAQKVKVIFMSGREEKYRPQTETFLRNLYYWELPLFMRETGDKRNDAIVKRELFNAHIRDKFNVLFCLDDRDRIVKLWRDMGLSCFQVNYGAF